MFKPNSRSLLVREMFAPTTAYPSLYGFQFGACHISYAQTIYIYIANRVGNNLYFIMSTERPNIIPPTWETILTQVFARRCTTCIFFVCHFRCGGAIRQRSWNRSLVYRTSLFFACFFVSLMVVQRWEPTIDFNLGNNIFVCFTVCTFHISSFDRVVGEIGRPFGNQQSVNRTCSVVRFVVVEVWGCHCERRCVTLIWPCV